MNPVCYEIGSLTIHWYGVFMAAGFLAGLLNWHFLARREGKDFSFCSDLLFWVMVSGVLGARIAYVATHYKDFLGEPLSVFRIDQGGIVYYGGFLGAGVGLLAFAKARKQKLSALVDFVITALPLGHAFGRVGCFLNGCCYGAEHHGPLAVRFPADSPPWWQHVYAGKILRFDHHSLPVHPLQLYEAAWNLVLYAIIILAFRYRKRDGFVTAVYLLLYPTARFLIEFLRGDRRIHWFGFSVNQYLSIVLFAIGCAILARLKMTEDRRTA